MDIPKHIYEKLQKLLRKADSAKEVGNLAEAEAFANKATEILMEYNLSREQIDLEDKPKVVREHITNQDKNFLPKNEGRWLVLLYRIIANHNLCRVVTHEDGRFGLSIMGEKINIEIVRYICDQLEAKIRILVKEAYRNYNGLEKKNAFIRGFYLGAVQGIDDKLRDNKEEMVKANPNITALVIVKDRAVVDFMKQEFPRLSKGRSASYSAQDGKGLGYQAGKNVAINKGVGNGSLGRNLLN